MCPPTKGKPLESLKTDRLSLMLDQLDRAREMCETRLTGLTDDEYLWEPAPGAWSIHRRKDATSPKPYGPGEWVIDDASEDPDPAPVTTIAWRLGHLHWSFAGRWEWTFGERKQSPKVLVDFAPTAALGQERFWALMDRWRESIATLTEEQLDTTGFGQFPNGSDPDWPFASVLWWTNLEFVHHAAEMGLLRDLYRAQ